MKKSVPALVLIAHLALLNTFVHLVSCKSVVAGNLLERFNDLKLFSRSSSTDSSSGVSGPGTFGALGSGSRSGSGISIGISDATRSIVAQVATAASSVILARALSGRIRSSTRCRDLSPYQKLGTTPVYYLCNSKGAAFLQEDTQAGNSDQKVVNYFMSIRDANMFLDEMSQVNSQSSNDFRLMTMPMEKVMNQIQSHKQSRKIGRLPLDIVYRLQPSAQQCKQASIVLGKGNVNKGLQKLHGMAVPLFSADSLYVERANGETVKPFYLAYEDLLSDWKTACDIDDHLSQSPFVISDDPSSRSDTRANYAQSGQQHSFSSVLRKSVLSRFSPAAVSFTTRTSLTPTSKRLLPSPQVTVSDIKDVLTNHVWKAYDIGSNKRNRNKANNSGNYFLNNSLIRGSFLSLVSSPNTAPQSISASLRNVPVPPVSSTSYPSTFWALVNAMLCILPSGRHDPPAAIIPSRKELGNIFYYFATFTTRYRILHKHSCSLTFCTQELFNNEFFFRMYFMYRCRYSSTVL